MDRNNIAGTAWWSTWRGRQLFRPSQIDGY
jgi:hypothetical protein